MNAVAWNIYHECRHQGTVYFDDGCDASLVVSELTAQGYPEGIVAVRVNARTPPIKPPLPSGRLLARVSLIAGDRIVLGDDKVKVAWVETCTPEGSMIHYYDRHGDLCEAFVTDDALPRWRWRWPW